MNAYNKNGKCNLTTGRKLLLKNQYDQQGLAAVRCNYLK